MRGLNAELVLEFIQAFRFHPDTNLRSDLLRKYIDGQRNFGWLDRWNLAVITRKAPGATVELGVLGEVRLLTRSKLSSTSDSTTANIGTLMSKPDRVADLLDSAEATARNEKQLLDLRDADKSGLVLLYPIDKDSEPKPGSQTYRTKLGAVEHIIGTAFSFPRSAPGSMPKERDSGGCQSLQSGQKAQNPTKSMWTTRVTEMKWISAVSDNDLHAIWSVLQTEASGPEAAIEAVPSGIQISAGEVLLGVDNNGRRILLVPLRPGEAFAEDKSGRAIRLLRIRYEDTTYLAAISLREDLDSVFTQFVSELLGEISTASSAAAATVAALSRWRLLFSSGDTAGILSDQALIGLIAELLTLQELLESDEQRRLSVWLGPSGFQHDFRSGSLGIEVKGTLVREGRVSTYQLRLPARGASGG